MRANSNLIKKYVLRSKVKVIYVHSYSFYTVKLHQNLTSSFEVIGNFSVKVKSQGHMSCLSACESDHSEIWQLMNIQID